jgi:hypothetical protein
MPQRRIEHTFECDADTFWSEVFFNDEYNQKLFLERLKFERWVVVERTETADGFRRVIEAVPSVGDLPGPIKALLENGVGYREEGEYSRSKSHYSVRVTPSSLADRVQVTGQMDVEDLGGGRCRRVYLADVTARVRFVGGMLEKRILDDIERSYEKSAKFTESWLRDHIAN